MRTCLAPGYEAQVYLAVSGFSAAAPASADEPGAEFKLRADDTLVSPDHQLRMEQYSKDMGDEGFLHQFWAFDDKIEAWRCVYNLKTGAFSVPPAFAEHNAKAVKTPRADRK
ncbi:hypothetical protein [Bradyrhizobium sp. Ash2021]|uniref:hypothetical protein n=1 Tax=Bradyrhizobium sp. Ash2021 TaxID=2954771 RepID=UPI0028155DAF|nr:hypothetical protein [Bradyrhizobium sp. Ash2021]WMT78714.1 hypothetical protein NL528_21255 [Bradyrhizobium sp. Ash2021]